MPNISAHPTVTPTVTNSNSASEAIYDRSCTICKMTVIPATNKEAAHDDCGSENQGAHHIHVESFRFLYEPRGPGFGAASSIRATISFISQSVSVTPAAIAGLSLCAPCWRQKLYQTK